MPDPKIINSKHNGKFTCAGITVDVCIYRLDTSKWTLEIVDKVGTSIVWAREFETDDDGHTEFSRWLRRANDQVVFRSCPEDMGASSEMHCRWRAPD